MTRHLGASMVLSVAVVGFFAVVLYQPDKAPPAPPSIAPIIQAEPAATPLAPSPTPGVPLSQSEAAELTLSAPIVRTSPSNNRLDREAPMVQSVSQKRARPQVRGGFTEVVEGETLDDVAFRVYGSTEESRTLWLANRDILTRRDGALAAGTLLRTP